MSASGCLFCYSTTGKCQLLLLPKNGDDGDDISISNSTQKDLLFILKKVLQLPNEYLDKWGAGLSSTSAKELQLCEVCAVEVERAKVIYEQLLVAVRQFKEIQGKLVIKVKEGSGVRSGDRDTGDGNSLVNFADKIRKYVVEGSCNRSNSFVIDSDDSFYFNKGNVQPSHQDNLPTISGDFSEGKVECGDDFEHLNKSCPRIYGQTDVDVPVVFEEELDIKIENESDSDGGNVEENYDVDLDGDVEDAGARSECSEQNGEDDEEEEPAESEDADKDEEPGSSVDDEEEESEDERPSKKSKQSIFKCKKCQMSYLSKNGLMVHMRRHHKAQKSSKSGSKQATPTGNNTASNHKFKCPEVGCGMTFLRRYLLTNHISRHSNQPQYKCEFCNNEFFDKSSLKRHERKIHPEATNSKDGVTGSSSQNESFPCDICAKVFKSRTGRSNHMIIVHKIKRPLEYPCLEEGCGRVFKKHDYLKVHLFRNHGHEPMFKCLECGEAFGTWKQKWIHQQKIHQDGLKTKPFVCELCGRGYSCMEYLTTHKSQSHRATNRNSRAPNKVQVQPAMCEQCGKTLKSQQHLRIHILVVHEKHKMKNACHLCQKRFICPRELKAHLFSKHQIGPEENRINKTSFKEKKFQCSVTGCKVRFKKEEKFKEHMKNIHGGEGGGTELKSRFQCKYCGKNFFHGNKLRYHESIHENKESKPYFCDICEKRFSTPINLQYHRKYTHKIQNEHIDICRKSIKIVPDN